MQGKTQAELYDARDAEERKELARDLQRRQELGLNGSLADEFERFSEASAPLDEIIAIRATDPKKMKAGQDYKEVNSAFKNDQFFRQAETVSDKVKKAMQA